jgi:hypothetical protein
MNVKIPEELKSQAPQSTWGKILTGTPVIMAVVATMLAALSSSEMTKAQYDRSLGAQQQSKAGDQWSFFQAKRLRGAAQRNTLDLLRATCEIHPLDPEALRSAVEALGKPDLAEMVNSAAARDALALLAQGRLPQAATPAVLDAKTQAAIGAVADDRPETEVGALLAPVSDRALDSSLAAAEEASRAFDAATKPASQMIDRLDGLLGRSLELARQDRDFTAARLRFEEMRYDGEARLNQNIAYLYELQVRKSNISANHHHARSQKFFYGMLAAQLAVIVATFAVAARQRNLLWTIAAVAGLLAVILAIYVYLCV